MPTRVLSSSTIFGALEDRVTDLEASFSTRALLVTAVSGGASWPDGTLVSDGTVMYKASAGATDISDLSGLVPFGDPFVEHFGATVYATQAAAISGTSVSAAVAAAITYAVSTRTKTINFRPGFYRVASAIAVESGDLMFVGASNTRETQLVNTSASSDIFTVGPASATNPATSAIAYVSFENLTMYQSSATPTGGAAIRAVKTNNLRIKSCNFRDHFHHIHIRGCLNCDYIENNHSTVLMSAAAGSSQVFISALELSDTSLATCFTHRFEKCLFGDSPDSYDTLVYIRASDYTMFESTYFAHSNCHLLLEPEFSDSTLVGVKCYDCYFDGASTPATGDLGLIRVRNGNSTNTVVSNLRLHDCTVGQSGYGIVIDDGVELGSVSIHDSYLQFLEQNAVLCNAKSGRISVSNCRFINWGTSPSTTPDQRAILVDGDGTGGAELDVLGCNFYHSNLAREAIEVDYSPLLKIVGNTFSCGAAEITYTNSPKVVTKSNISDRIDLEDFDSEKEGTYSPTVAFGGGSTGVTYTTRLGRWTRTQNLLRVDVQIILSSKGSSTGNLTVSLPQASAGSQTVVSSALVSSVFSGTFTGFRGVFARIPGGSSVANIVYQSDTGAGIVATAVTNADVDNTMTLTFSVTYAV